MRPVLRAKPDVEPRWLQVETNARRARRPNEGEGSTQQDIPPLVVLGRRQHCPHRDGHDEDVVCLSTYRNRRRA